MKILLLVLFAVGVVYAQSPTPTTTPTTWFQPESTPTAKTVPTATPKPKK